MDNIKQSVRNNGQTEYRVQGTDGWTLVTNDRSLAVKESQKSTRDYGTNSVYSGRELR